jgi:ABC-type glycerol-3-phosphate transport system substrate-binding protein
LNGIPGRFDKFGKIGGLELFGKRRLTKVNAVLVALVLISMMWAPISEEEAFAEADTIGKAKVSEEPASAGQANVSESSRSYSDYIQHYHDAARPAKEIRVQAADYSQVKGDGFRRLENYEGVQGLSLLTGEKGEVSWKIHVDAEGLYNVSATYFPIEGKSANMERGLRIDGEVPFQEAGYLEFDRVWDNELKEVKRDNRGNDLRPEQMERPRWQEAVFKDSEGYYNDPFQFYFTAGDHVLTLYSSREPMVIRDLKLFQQEASPTYEEALKIYKQEGIQETTGQLIEIQGEAATAKSSPTLYPLSDHSSSAVSPYSASKVKVNTIGGYNWRLPGQWIEWEADIPETGLYKIAFKSQQNFVRGIYSTRKLTIDGKVPFEEMKEVAFRYKSGYRMDVMGGKEPYLFRLDKGKHVIRLEVQLGEFAPLIREVQDSLYTLNAEYRKILMITGTQPDEARDYRIEKQLPDLLGTFKKESDRLKSVSAQLKKLAGGSSDQEALLKTMALQLDEMAANPETIPRRLSSYKSNAGGLGTWLQQAREQPLEIDSLYIASPQEKLPSAGMGFFSKLWHEVATFFYSFFIDYNQIGNVAETKDQRTITVWVGSGRDQADTIKAMIDETFTPATGINVNLKLVQMNTLLPATLAGQGPDVAMQIGNDIPVNYGMRHAAADLTQFSDFEMVKGRFRTSAMVPYTYNKGVYALPETQTFDMLFYRKDILKELGLQIPDTWDDVTNILTVLNKNHMEFGLPVVTQPAYPGANVPPNPIYAALLLQSGGEFYREDGKQSDLDSRKGIEAFKQWTEYYTDYKLEREFDFANRFRSGQMPIGIADYTTYNQLTVFAPEIRGMWDFVPVPGMKQKDGTINREVPGGGSGVIMLQSAKDKDAAWTFMKWWTSKDIQVKFGREMEGLMGAAARYPTANIEALDQLPWPVTDYENLKSQFEWVRGIPEVPGGYFTGRHLLNAFYKVVNNQTEAREAMMDYVQYIQDEIRTKRKEFGLPD